MPYSGSPPCTPASRSPSFTRRGPGFPRVPHISSRAPWFLQSFRAMRLRGPVCVLVCATIEPPDGDWHARRGRRWVEVVGPPRNVHAASNSRQGIVEWKGTYPADRVLGSAGLYGWRALQTNNSVRHEPALPRRKKVHSSKP